MDVYIVLDLMATINMCPVGAFVYVHSAYLCVCVHVCTHWTVCVHVTITKHVSAYTSQMLLPLEYKVHGRGAQFTYIKSFSSTMSFSITEGTRKNGNRPCNSKGCKTCRLIRTTDRFRSTVTKRSYKVRTPATCKSKRVVYLIECKIHQKQYVGSTKNALHIRLNGHRYDIRKMKTQKSAVAKHFNQPGHTRDHLTIMVIEKLRNNNIQFRRRRERFWIDKLRCMAPEGMNLT